MKVSSSSKKEPTTKVGKLEEKLLSSKAEISKLKEELRLKRKEVKNAVKSRDLWKAKHKAKTKKINCLEKKLKVNNRPKGHHYELNLINLCILLRIVGGCSYRSIPRILKVLEMCFDIPWQKIPCANSVENWVSKLGLYHMEKAVENIKGKSEEVCLIIDETLRIGNERMLLFLITPNEKEKETALSYDDVEVLHMCGKRSWTGENIKSEVEKITADKKIKVAFILSDEDSKLLKSSRLLEQSHLPDIGHAIGSCLRKVFKDDSKHKSMIKLFVEYQRKSINQDLSYLRPPKQRVKARFMNLAPLVKWGITMISLFEKLNEKEQDFFKEILNHKPILYTLSCCMELSKEISVPLKNKGLSQSTLKNFKSKLSHLKIKIKERRSGKKSTEPEEQWIVKSVEKYIGHLESYLKRYEDFLGKKEQSYPVSTDIIESIFGKHKGLVSTNGLVGMSILDLELPVHCQSVNELPDKIKQALESVSITSLIEWKQEHSSSNQALKRRLFFKKRA